MKTEISTTGGSPPPLQNFYGHEPAIPYPVAEGQKERVRSHDRDSLEQTLSVIAMGGDFMMIVLGFMLALWLRFYSGLIPMFYEDASLPSVADYSGLILFGVVTVFAGLLAKNVYGPGRLRSAKNTILAIAAVTGACLFIFTGMVTVLRTDPPISRLFVVCAFCFIFMGITAWRVFLGRLIMRPAMARRLSRRLLIIGWNDEAARIKRRIERNDSSYEYVGWMATNGETYGAQQFEFDTLSWQSSNGNPEAPLGTVEDTLRIIRQHDVDLVVYADREAHRGDIVAMAKVCELEQVDFKMVPRFFEILVSGLRPGRIGGVPVLGVEALPLNNFENRMLKRLADVLGALAGLTISIPVIAFFGALVFLESLGPIIYRQVRMGRNGRPFRMLKIRSMRADAEADGKPRWAEENDSRRLKVGAFMRRWNIDELPQFWNVLKGEMSLVGPRPERPELIERFKHEIPHYQARHTCPPGMTGWAQVNGLRGNTSLHDRIREDIWYVENWSLWLDMKIVALTFFRFSNAY